MSGFKLSKMKGKQKNHSKIIRLYKLFYNKITFYKDNVNIVIYNNKRQNKYRGCKVCFIIINLVCLSIGGYML